MELECKHHGNASITKLIYNAQLHLKIAWHYTLLNLYKSRVSRKHNNLSEEFEFLTEKIQFHFVLVACTLLRRQIANLLLVIAVSMASALTK